MDSLSKLQFLELQAKLDTWDKKQHTRLRLIRGRAEDMNYTCLLDTCREDLSGFIFEGSGRGRPSTKELSDLALYGDYLLPKEIMVLRALPTSQYYALLIKP